jgi:hypothetical protein
VVFASLDPSRVPVLASTPASGDSDELEQASALDAMAKQPTVRAT